MRARWDPTTERWEASAGHGKNRKWFRSRDKENGEAIVNAKYREFTEGPEACITGSLAEFIELDFWPRQMFNSKNTRMRYAATIKNHFAHLCPMQLAEIRLAVLQATVNQWCKLDEAGSCSNAKTVRTNYGLLKQVLNLARLMGRISHTDYDLVVLPELPVKEVPILSLTDGEKLIAAANGTSMEGPTWAIFHFAIRPGEICGLKVPHVALFEDHATVTIKDNRQQWGESDALKNKKRGEKRVLTVPRWMGEKLLSYAPKDAVYIFHTQLGKPVQPAYMAKQIEELCKKAGVEDIKFYNLRHSCATILSNQGVPVAVIRDILGHATIQMTMKYIQQQPQQVLAAFSGRSTGVGQ